MPDIILISISVSSPPWALSSSPPPFLGPARATTTVQKNDKWSEPYPPPQGGSTAHQFRIAPVSMANAFGISWKSDSDFP